MSIKPIAITPGEPAGIGPDILLQAFAKQHKPLPIIAIADIGMLRARAKKLNINLAITEYSESMPYQPTTNQLTVAHIPLHEPAQVGKLNVNNASYVVNTIKLAAEGCMKHQFSAMVTGPIHKGIINEAGIAFTGHTEYLAQITNAKLPVMVLMSSTLKVALLTTHLPLASVPARVTTDSLTQTLTIIQNALKTQFSITHPRITVCGLNPHAGENGHIGREEMTIIEPALQQLRQQGYQLQGPVSADTAFTPASLEKSDIVLAMYHDQGLAPFKALCFGEAINITLGLPIIRTSVDHGVALDIAGSGCADHNSLMLAIKTAMQLSK